MPEDWSREEVEAAVSDYFDMLTMELRGEPFNKAEHNRNLQKLLNNRPKGSVERKHQNISAVLIQLGYPYIYGYKPLPNYQRLLRSVVEERLGGALSLHKVVAAAVAQPVATAPVVSDILSILVAPPEPEDTEPLLREQPKIRRQYSRRNYLEAEARNQSLGIAGEEFVMHFEHARLWRAGEKKLAERIEHVARTKGDYLGYDILSFETNGRERLIEVKTTRFGPMTPIFASRYEVDFSESQQVEYQLYRLFNFTREPKLFVLAGSLQQNCELDPVQYKATVKPAARRLKIGLR